MKYQDFFKTSIIMNNPENSIRKKKIKLLYYGIIISNLKWQGKYWFKKESPVFT